MPVSEQVREVAKKGLSYELYRSLLFTYGKRGEKAYFYLKDRRVKRYLDFFVVVGREEYIVEDEFCTCADFLINLRGKGLCSHIIAVELAKITGIFDKIDTYYVDFLRGMDWRRIR